MRKLSTPVMLVLLFLGVMLISFLYSAVTDATHLGVPAPLTCDIEKPKCVQECTGHETVGRCADKCPANTAQGSYYIQGFDKETGAAICGFSYRDECPYAHVDLHDALCRKLAEQNDPEEVPATLDMEVGGK